MAAPVLSSSSSHSVRLSGHFRGRTWLRGRRRAHVHLKGDDRTRYERSSGETITRPRAERVRRMLAIGADREWTRRLLASEDGGGAVINYGRPGSPSAPRTESRLSGRAPPRNARRKDPGEAGRSARARAREIKKDRAHTRLRGPSEEVL